MLAALPAVNGSDPLPPPPPPPPPAPAQADLGLVSLAVDNPTPVAGDTVTLSAQVSNLGPDAAANAGLTLSLAAGVEWVSGAAGCAPADARVLCDLGTLGSGDSAARSLTLRVTTVGSPGLTAGVASDTQDPSAANDGASITLEVQAPPPPPPPPPPPSGDSADLYLKVFQATSATPKVGSAAGFKFIVYNLGPDASANTRFVLPIPPSMSWVSGPTECSHDAAQIVCDYGSLTKGASRTRYLYLRMTVTGPQGLTGSAVADTADPAVANNAVTVEIDVQP